MITKAGKTIIAKMFGNQVENAFSFLVLGVGCARPQYPVAKPIVDDSTSPAGWKYDSEVNGARDTVRAFKRFESPNLSNKNELDFEVLRLPIRESSVVFENGETKLCLNAIIPTRNRYEFSEIGVFSADSNAFLASKAPQILFSFGESERWTSAVADNDGNVTQELITINPANPDDKTYYRKATDLGWYEPDSDGEFQNKNYSSVRISEWGLVLSAITGQNKVENDEPLINLLNALPEDELRIAFSYRNFDAVSDDNWKIKLSLMDVNGDVSVLEFDKDNIMEQPVEDDISPDDVNWNNDNVLFPMSYRPDNNVTDGYAVVANQKQNFVVQPKVTIDGNTFASTFNYGAIDKATLEFVNSNTDNKPQICLDGMRFDTKNYNNPAYGLVSYSVVQNNLDPEGVPVADSTIKDQNGDPAYTYESVGVPQLFVKKSGTETIIEYKILLNNYDVRNVEEDETNA